MAEYTVVVNWRNIIVIRCEHHRNDWLVGNVKRLELLRWLRIGEVDAL